MAHNNIIQFTKTTKAREGRDNQVYSAKTGARLIAGCVALNEDKTKLIMVTSAKHKNRWIIPKGGIEKDEENDYAITAIRETWEEAGIIGNILAKLTPVEDHRFVKELDEGQKAFIDVNNMDDDLSKIPRSEFHFYEMEVKELCQEWPESDTRDRRWCTYSEAKHELTKAKRPELLAALNESSIRKDIEDVDVDPHGNIIDKHMEVDNY
ncbi:hypothetical protein PACTADRAFT_50465 [Pachysolen tannophilus NRRL Y-2460]|uniref:Nudix hydrolase domain-containing protein n=1 Tax=Pachysolen tannophilus NRRL Y-2460 TaxID=669874 RepID=A0A1E4TS63_PACTA|nr:hypothetical protein PACTADRAFT_50465 [Pachysolen tannophilus NRRL Y-2460]